MSLPDTLTITRAVSVPFVILLYAWNFDGHNYWATALFAAAMATDWFDGRIAAGSLLPKPSLPVTVTRRPVAGTPAKSPA